MIMFSIFFEVRFNGERSHIFKALENIALKKESSKDTLKVKDAYKDLDFKQLIKDRDFFLIIYFQSCADIF